MLHNVYEKMKSSLKTQSEHDFAFKIQYSFILNNGLVL